MEFTNMTLKEKVLQTFVVTAREVNRFGGPKAFFEKYKVGGLFYNPTILPEDPNMVENGSRMRLSMLADCRKYSQIPLLVCADAVRFEGQKISAGLNAMGAVQDEKLAYEKGKVAGMQFNSVGVDWILGSCIDLLYDSSMVLDAMCQDPVITAKLFRQFAKGIQDQGVIATAKHFPGMGTTNINMHFAPGVNKLDFDEWMNTYGYTYKEMIDEGVLSIMTTHTTLTSYDSEGQDGYYPIATYSEKLTKELLKEKLGFGGAVVTDALIMGGMATGDLVAETVQAFKCGADLLLWPPMEAADAIVRALENGDIPMSRLDDALERINKLREFRENAIANNIADTPDTAYADKVNKETIERAVALCRNDDGIIPIAPNKKILIVDATSNDKMKIEKENADGSIEEVFVSSAEALKMEFEKNGYSCDVKRDTFDVPSNVFWQEDVNELIKDYDYVVLDLKTQFVTTWDVPYMQIWGLHMMERKKRIVVNLGSPFFVPQYFPQDPTIINVNSVPSATSVKTVVDGIIGKITLQGKPRVKETR